MWIKLISAVASGVKTSALVLFRSQQVVLLKSSPVMPLCSRRSLVEAALQVW
jgi:hypothetical protein